MVEINDRRLPVGIQSFEEIRKQGCLYVDKTDIIWQLANRNKTYNYLSRPRRFGKSVLVDTLEAYFMGKKELFEGLKIMQLETEWVKRPVIRLDMSRAGAEPGTLRSYLNNIFKHYEKVYSLVPDPTDSLADRLIVVTGSVSFTPHRMTPVFVEKSKRHVKVAIRAIVAHHTISLQGVLYINKSLFNLVVETYCYEYPSHIVHFYFKYKKSHILTFSQYTSKIAQLATVQSLSCSRDMIL